jgi:hypothetical protein
VKKDNRAEFRLPVESMEEALRKIIIKRSFKDNIYGKIVNVSNNGLAFHVEMNRSFPFEYNDKINIRIPFLKKNFKGIIRYKELVLVDENDIYGSFFRVGIKVIKKNALEPFIEKYREYLLLKK